jgi:hypothetical protein
MTPVRVSILNDHAGVDKTIIAYTDIEESHAFKRWCADMSQAFGVLSPICYREPTNTDLWETTAEMECRMGGNGIEVRFKVLTDQSIDDKILK